MPRVSLIWVILLVLVAALAGYWAHQEHSLAVASAEHAAEVDRKLAESVRTLSSLSRRAALADTARAKAEAKLAASAPAATEGAKGNTPPNMVHLRDLVRDHPELEATRMMILRRDALRQFGDRLAKLNLPHDQLGQLENLLVERSLAAGDAKEAARQAGLAEGTPAFNQAIVNAQTEVEGEIGTLIGKDSAKQLFSSINYKGEVENLGLAMAENGTSLTSEQAETLADLMAQANQAGPPKGTKSQNFFQADPATGLTGRNQMLLDQAASVFPAAQLQALRNALISNNQQQQQMQAIFKLLPSGSGFMDD
jgi:hypothetical protein